jgi:Fic family protein
LQSVSAAAAAARRDTLFLLQRNRFFVTHRDNLTERQRDVLERLFAQGPARINEGISARSYAKITGVSGPTATRDLTALEHIGALERSAAGGRSTVYRIVLD